MPMTDTDNHMRRIAEDIEVMLKRHREGRYFSLDGEMLEAVLALALCQAEAMAQFYTLIPDDAK